MKPSILQSKFKSVLVLIIWGGIWQVGYWYVGKDILVPSPFQTLQILVNMMSSVEIYKHIGVTIYRVCIGVSLSFVLGVITAISAYFFEGVRIFLAPFLVLLKSTPVIAIIILALLWFKSGDVPIFSCILMCYPIIYTNILVGLDCVDNKLIEMAKVFKVNTKYILKQIYMPHTISYIKSALSVSIGLAWKVVVAAEVLSVPKYSMGYNLFNAKIYLETAEVFAWVIIIVLLSSLFEKGINYIIFKSGRVD